jgi:signal transduction histidine kinase
MPSDPRATLTVACSWSIAGHARASVCAISRPGGSWKAPPSARGSPLDKQAAPGRPAGDNNRVEADAGAIAVRQDRTPVQPDHTDPGLAPAPAPDRLRAPGPLRFWLTIGLVLAALGALDTLAQLPTWRDTPALATVNVIMSMAFILTGLLLRREDGQRGVAWALILAGVFRSLDFVDGWTGGPWAVYTVVFGGIDRIFGGYAILRYPRPALSRIERAYLATLAGWMLVTRGLVVVTSTAASTGYPASDWWPTISASGSLNNLFAALENIGDGVLGLIVVVFLVRRLIQTKGLDRIVIAPVIAAGLAAVAAASVTAVAQIFSNISDGPTDAFLAESLVDFLLPAAFLVAVIQRGLLTRNLAALVGRVATGADLTGVRYALRETLHDPTLEVLELPATGPSAGPALPVPRSDHRLTEVIRTDAGAPIAVVIADEALARYRGLFDAAVRTSGLALRNAQLQAQAAQAELDSVRASRARLAEVALAERRRLERDLHDGAQQHLLALAARLSAAMASTSDPDATAAFAQVRTDLSAVLAELRDLAHGIHPAALVQSGLAAALEEVAERLPLAIHLDVPDGPGDRPPAATEATAYFVACEALTNVVKHARASQVSVTVRISAGELVMDIADDGAGGADPAGRGLANIMDRAGAAGGEAVIDSPPGQGTRLRLRIPCA